MTHSGDKSQNGCLIHSIKISNLTHHTTFHDFTLGGVGYQSTPLMSQTFTHQKPSMCCYSPQNHTVYVIPFNQTEAILGKENTTLVSGVVKRSGRNITLVPITAVPNK